MFINTEGNLRADRLYTSYHLQELSRPFSTPTNKNNLAMRDYP